MYKVVTKEDTIRIPAEYMRKGQSLDQHIDRLSMDAFEGKFDAENRFVLVTNNHKTIGRGRIIHGDGAIYQRVQFDAVLFCMDDQEVVEGAVSEVNEFGAFVRIGPMEALLHSLRSWTNRWTSTSEPTRSPAAKQVANSPSVRSFELESCRSPPILRTHDVPRSV